MPQTATAQSYAGYPDYYSQQQQQQSQYYYPQGYQAQGTASRVTSQPQTATTAAAPTSATADNTHRTSGGSFDYAQAQAAYPSAYSQHQYMPQGRSSIPGHSSQWQGYPMASPSVPHGYSGQPGHYPMQPWQGGGYYPPGNQPPHTAPPAPTNKKTKKEAKDEYKGLGKRAPEAVDHVEPPVEKETKKGKKGKKEPEEKPIPKPPPKSHLHPPRQAQSAWQLFFTDELNKAKAAAAQGNSPGGTPLHAKLNVAQIAKDAGTAYANLDGEQKKYYAAKVQESKEQYARELKVWQATLTPEDIRVENAFRAQQRKEGKSRKGNLKDPNAPKKPLSAYFLFLKGIRENDDLRAKVWAEETETTKQSVLAAERWRSLSDDEKRVGPNPLGVVHRYHMLTIQPFLQQAERDKQDYEAARKVYEDEAAARARGEEYVHKTDPHAEASKIVPPIPLAAVTNEHGQTVSIDSIVAPPTPAVETQPQARAETTSLPDFAQFTNVSDEDTKPAETATFDQSMDDFQGFSDPLEDMDLSGLGAMTADGEQSHQQWDLTNLMGEQSGVQSKEQSADANVDVAPTMAEAVSESTELPSEPVAKTEPEIQQVATEAEGEMSVPDVGPSAQPASGAPTEEVSEMPQADAPPFIEDSNDAGPTEHSESAEQPSFGAGAGGEGVADDNAAANGTSHDAQSSPKTAEPAPSTEEPTMEPAGETDNQ